MMHRFHELRRHEEGQALVLAAISLLILTLCVLATVNLTYAVSHKIQLQNAADAAAYTTAAYQARAMNFFAYTNRAMVCQYCGQMNLMAMLTYVMFILAILTALSYIPYVGIVFQILQKIVYFALRVIDPIVALVVPLIDGLNYLTGLVQFAVSTDIAARILAGPGNLPELQNLNKGYVVDNVSATLLGVSGALKWEKTVSTSAVPTLAAPTGQEDQFNRAMMTEIANSARHEWTAYGGKNWGNFPTFRHGTWNVNFGPLKFSGGKMARTEWGSFKPSGAGGSGFWNFLKNLTSVTEQLYSIDQFDFKITFAGVGIKLDLNAWAKADRKGLFGTDHKVEFTADPCFGLSGLAKAACKITLGFLIQPVVKAVAAGLAAAQIPDIIGHFHFGMAPYARFRPGQSNWASPSGKELFNQPPVVLLLTEPATQIVKNGKPFMQSFGVTLGGLNSANSKLMAETGNKFSAPKQGWRNQTDFRPTGNKFLTAPDGFHALSAALTYYHRPGDWREPPNVFNPFWGAKLMPVTDYPLLGNAAVLGPFMNYLVH